MYIVMSILMVDSAEGVRRDQEETREESREREKEREGGIERDETEKEKGERCSNFSSCKRKKEGLKSERGSIGPQEGFHCIHHLVYIAHACLLAPEWDRNLSCKFLLL